MAENMLLLQNTYDVLYPRAESRNALKYTSSATGWYSDAEFVSFRTTASHSAVADQQQKVAHFWVFFLNRKKLIRSWRICRDKRNVPSGKQFSKLHPVKAPLKTKV